MAIDSPRRGDRPNETPGRDPWQPMTPPRPSGPGFDRPPSELGHARAFEVARIMVAIPGTDFRTAVRDRSALQPQVYPSRHSYGSPGLSPTESPEVLAAKLGNRERETLKRDPRTDGERQAAIARHADEIRQGVNYSGDGPPELTTALETEIGLEARYRDVHGLETELAAQDHAELIGQAQVAAQAEEIFRSEAAAHREDALRKNEARAAARQAPTEDRATTQHASTDGTATKQAPTDDRAVADTKDALRAATPPATKQAEAPRDSYTPSPSRDRLRAQRMEMWANPDRRGQSR